jgi:hypothetical protein
MGKIKFVAVLWLLAAIGWFLGGTTLFIKLRFQMGQETALMKSTDPVIARALKYNPNDYLPANVVFETGHGNVPVTNMLLRPEDLKPLADGKGVSLRFRKGNPHEVLYEFEDKPWGIGWLLLALVATPLAFYAHRQLRRETD